MRCSPLVATVLSLPSLIGCDKPLTPTPTSGPSQGPAGAVTLLQGSALETSVVLDPVGDVPFGAAPFQDIVRSEISKEGGTYVLRMHVAAPIPEHPPLAPTAASGIVWFWVFNLDTTTGPPGYPFVPGLAEPGKFSPGLATPGEFFVQVSWDGTAFTARAVDRRPLFSGQEDIVTPVTFSIDGEVVEAVFPAALMGDPASFGWGTRTADRSGPPGSPSGHRIDVGGASFNPWPPVQ